MTDAKHEAPAEPCFECGSTERTGTACKPCNPEITDPNFGHEAPAEGAGELDRAIRRMRNQLVGSATFMQLMFGREDVRKVLDALEDLRARSSAPEARSGEGQ